MIDTFYCSSEKVSRRGREGAIKKKFGKWKCKMKIKK
jgi:hypothetical protein